MKLYKKNLGYRVFKKQCTSLEDSPLKSFYFQKFLSQFTWRQCPTRSPSSTSPSAAPPGPRRRIQSSWSSRWCSFTSSPCSSCPWPTYRSSGCYGSLVTRPTRLWVSYSSFRTTVDVFEGILSFFNIKYRFSVTPKLWIFGRSYMDIF